MAQNPLLTPWTTPFGAPPFDAIAPDHFSPAFDQGMEEHWAEIEAIAAVAAPPSFANTIVAMERSGRTLGRVAALFFNPADPRPHGPRRLLSHVEHGTRLRARSPRPHHEHHPRPHRPPRKTLDYATPGEQFASLLAAAAAPGNTLPGGVRSQT